MNNTVRCITTLFFAAALAPLSLAQGNAQPPAQEAAAQQKPPARPSPMFRMPEPPHGTVQNYQPVTKDMLLHPSPDDWLMYSRTYDAWRYSPLKQINKKTVKNLRMDWALSLPAGQTETIPIVHDGVMYTIVPGANVMAINATNGDIIWEYVRHYKQRQLGSVERTKTIAIYKDMVYFTAPDGYVVALDAKTGKVRWETYKTDTQNTSGAIVVDGNVISGGTCGPDGRVSCFIEADNADTGEKVWRFYNVPAPGDPGYDSWHGADTTKDTVSTWGLPGTFDPVRDVLYWGTANPAPYERLARHNGNPDGTGRIAPADLYSNCTLALDPHTGKLYWYYQYLPADDWDTDHTHERTLVTTKYDPDPKAVKWYNTTVPRGSTHDVAAIVGESGIMFVIDRSNGKFLWAEPIPYDTPNLAISNIDPVTGKTEINWSVVMKHPGDHHVICYWNGRSYWPTAYDPVTNSLYTGYIDNCLDMTANNSSGMRHGILRPGHPADSIAGIAKVNLSTGEMMRFATGMNPGTGGLLATAGGLIFHGDINRRFSAYDAATGQELWHSMLGGPISVSTITYAVNGRQYVAVITGNNLAEGVLAFQSGVPLVRDANAIYVFALPPK